MTPQRVLAVLLLASASFLLLLTEKVRADNPEFVAAVGTRITLGCPGHAGSAPGGDQFDTDGIFGCYASQADAESGGLNAANHALHNTTVNRYSCKGCTLPQQGCGKSTTTPNYSAVQCTTTLLLGGDCPPGKSKYETKCSALLTWSVDCAPCM